MQCKRSGSQLLVTNRNNSLWFISALVSASKYALCIYLLELANSLLKARTRFFVSASEITKVCFMHVCSALKKGSRCANNWFLQQKYKVFLTDFAQNFLNIVLISSMYNAKAYTAIHWNVKNSHVTHPSHIKCSSMGTCRTKIH